MNSPLDPRPSAADIHIANLAALVREKARSAPPLTDEEIAAGLRGWYRSGPLPHCDRRGLKQFVTYRLAGSLPAKVRAKRLGIRAGDPEATKWRKLEAWLSQDAAEPLLRDPTLAGLVDGNLRHLDGRLYRLIAWVVMPNHVHVLIEIDRVPIAKIVQCWKGYTARRINGYLGRSGPVWERNYFDTYVRDEHQLVRVIRYVEGNPVRAGWVRSARDWPYGSARFGTCGDQESPRVQS